MNIIVCLLPTAVATEVPKTLYKVYQAIELYHKPESETQIYCTSCMQFYKERGVQSNIHKLHPKATLVLYDIRDLYRMKL